MTASQESLYDVLAGVLGADHARTLMTSLPTDPAASKADINELKSDVAEIRTDIRDVRAELKDVRTEIKDVRKELKGDINELRTDIRQLDARIHGFYDTIHAQTRVHVAASMGSAVTVSGFVFIAAQLV